MDSVKEASIFDQEEKARTQDKSIKITREKYRKACLEILFSVCSAENDLNIGFSKTLIDITVKELISRCEITFSKYVNDKSLQGNFPLSRIRREEVKIILSSLSKFRIRLFDNDDKEYEKSIYKDDYIILLKLYPYFCECLAFEDNEILRLLKSCFSTIGQMWKNKFD